MIKKPERAVKGFRNKYLALTIITLLFSFTGSAQWQKPNNAYGTISNGQNDKRVFIFPTGCGAPSLNSIDSAQNGWAIYGDSCNDKVYFYNPKTKVWSTISGTVSDTRIIEIIDSLGLSSTIQDGRISGGIVSWVSGLTFDISAAVFREFGIIYHTNDTTITLNLPDANYSRIDLFALDTANGGETIKITGTPSPSPVAPQVSDYQVALTTGITLNVGDTVPANVSIQKIYDENIEWATSVDRGTVNFNDLSSPFTGSKDALVSSYPIIGRLVFTRTGNGVIDGSEVLKMRINLRKPLSSANSLIVGFFHDGSIQSSDLVHITTNNGLDPNKINQYQTITMPASDFQWMNPTYNRMILYATGYDTSGTGGFYLDDVELQTGVNNIPQQTDFSPVFIRNDSLFQSIKGIDVYVGKVTPMDSSVLHTIIPAVDSSNAVIKDLRGNPKYILEVWADGSDSNSNNTSGSVNSVTGNPSGLVDNTDPANPVIQQDASKLDKSDSTLANRITANTANIASNTTAIGDKAAKSTTLTINGIPQDLSTNRTWTIPLGDSVISFSKNVGKDSIILTLRDGRRFAIKDSIGAGGGGGTTDSAAYHSAIGFQDTSLILKRPNGTGDTISFHIGIPTIPPSWGLTGNTLSSDTNFIGTLNNKNLVFKRNSVFSGLIDSSSSVAGRTFFGFGAGLKDTTKAANSTNTAFGFKALNANIGGFGNTAIGNEALLSVTTSNNTALGNLAGQNVIGSYNTAVGNSAMLTGGSNNVAIGFNALHGTIGNNNVAIGRDALSSLSGAISSDIAIGYSALLGTTTGGSNIALGNLAGRYITTQSNNIVIGNSRNISYSDDMATMPFYSVQNTATLLSQIDILNAKVGIFHTSPQAYLHLPVNTAAATSEPILIDPPVTLSVTSASGNGTNVTFNFATSTYPFIFGESITVSGFTPSSYNGTYTVTNYTATSITIGNTSTASVTTYGTISIGALMSTVTDGAIERDSSALYYSSGNGTNLSRRKLVLAKSGGSNALVGQATLSSGTVTVSTTAVKSTSIILLTPATTGALTNVGTPTVGTITDGVSFVINSTNAADTSNVNFLIINP